MCRGCGGWRGGAEHSRWGEVGRKKALWVTMTVSVWLVRLVSGVSPWKVTDVGEGASAAGVGQLLWLSAWTGMKA